MYLPGLGGGIGIGIDADSDSDRDPVWVSGDKPALNDGLDVFGLGEAPEDDEEGREGDGENHAGDSVERGAQKKTATMIASGGRPVRRPMMRGVRR